MRYGLVAGFFAVFMIGALPAHSATESFSAWLQKAQKEALQKGISQKVVTAALPDTLKPIERIIELDRKQPESTRTLAQYLEGVLSQTRREEGRTRFLQNQIKLKAIGDKYQVDPQYVVALWGIETNYGKNMGGFDVVMALATLAYDGRRSDYFRGEMFKALKIIDEGHIKHADMKGSWAGAMGQIQFMPSSFFTFAVDHNGDGHKNIWTSQDDVFASAANYLAKSGWTHGQPWGRPVKLTQNIPAQSLGLENDQTIQYWQDHGVRTMKGNALPFEKASRAWLIQPDGKGTQAYIVYDNFKVIMKWNRSTYFATAVGTLADVVKK